MKLKKLTFTVIKVHFFQEDADIDNILISERFFLVRKIVITLFFPWVMIIKLNHSV